jgi:hypothetical protein
MASQQNSGSLSKSSHPAGNFRNKFKYNNTNGRYANRNGSQEQPQETQASPRDTYISQEELTKHLTAKLRRNKFVEVRTKEMKNERGTLYEIDVINPGLHRIGNGTFFSMKLHTVSHKSRAIFIRIIFNDDEARNADMRINVDAIIQIFREIAPDTIESVSITDVDDSKGSKHLAVIANTVKGASLNYTYERAMEFIHVVDEKYGTNGEVADTDCSVDEMTADQIDIETALLKEKIKALQELKQAKDSQSNQTKEGAIETTDAAPARVKSPTKFKISVGGKVRNIIH